MSRSLALNSGSSRFWASWSSLLSSSLLLVEVLTDTLELTLVPVTWPVRTRPMSSVNLTSRGVSAASGTIVGFSVVLLVVVGCSLLRSKFLNGRLIKPLDSLPLLDSSWLGDRFRLVDVGSRLLCLVDCPAELPKFLGFCGVTFVLVLLLLFGFWTVAWLQSQTPMSHLVSTIIPVLPNSPGRTPFPTSCFIHRVHR